MLGPGSVSPQTVDLTGHAAPQATKHLDQVEPRTGLPEYAVTFYCLGHVLLFPAHHKPLGMWRLRRIVTRHQITADEAALWREAVVALDLNPGGPPGGCLR